ncbi:MAG TPA: AMP-binding protein [Chryseolinea sp.]
MNTYPYDSITINNRQIQLDHILTGSTAPLSAFEASTYLFIKKWFASSGDFIQKTSGSTGPAKEISITRDQMSASAELTAKALGLKAGENSLLCLDPEFIAGKMMLVRTFIVGMKLIAVDPSSNPLNVVPLSVPVDFMAVVPLQLNAILDSESSGRINSIRNILVGGAALDESIQRKLAKLENPVYATYGMTETISHVALQPVNGPFASEYFTVLPGIKIDIDDRGCLEIYVPFLPEKIITNDLVEMASAEQFKWLGRVDNVINTGGKKVVPEKLEGQIRQMFDQQDIKNRFLISSRRDPLLGDRVILLIEGELRTISTQILKSSLQKILMTHEVPKEIYTNTRFVMTKNGKVNRAETARQIGN